MAILENIDKGILQNIDIDKISYRLGFGISNTPNQWCHPILGVWLQEDSDTDGDDDIGSNCQLSW